jgi:hypothetical protein
VPSHFNCSLPGLFAGINRPGRGLDYSYLSSAEVKEKQSYTSTIPLGLHSLSQGNPYLFVIEFISKLNLTLRNISEELLILTYWFVSSDVLVLQNFFPTYL